MKFNPSTWGSNGWTGGQYSVYRACLGLYLFVHFAHLTPLAAELFSNQGVLPDKTASPLIHLFPNILALSDGPGLVTAMSALAATMSLALAFGWRDRIAAIVVWYVMACFFGRDPLIINPGMPYVGLLLIVHALLPAKPYSSLAAVGRTDPGNGWHLPAPYFLALWVLMAAGYSYSGYTKLVSPSWVDGTAIEKVLQNPLARPGFFRDAALTLPASILKAMTWSALLLEILFLPLVLFRLTRPWVWALMTSMHLGLILLIDFADLSLGMVMLHFFTFNPAWLAPDTHPGKSRVFYDGHCGLCHGAVRFMLAEDHSASLFVFSPLHGDAFNAHLTADRRENLPDSIVVLTPDGRLLTKSAAIIHILDRLGGLWRVLSWSLWCIPAPLRNLAYDAIARVRKKIFGSPVEACPMLPPHLRARFEM